MIDEYNEIGAASKPITNLPFVKKIEPNKPVKTLTHQRLYTGKIKSKSTKEKRKRDLEHDRRFQNKVLEKDISQEDF